jgi:predicted ArsR family transcriptional regulator
MRWWETNIGGAMRGRIVRLLRRGEKTVDELAAELDVTDNGVRSHLTVLEDAGIVEQFKVRRTGTPGKPATVYRVAREAEPHLSAAYAPILEALLVALENRLGSQELDALFRDVGRKLAADQESAPKSASLATRAKLAASLLGELGAEIDVESTDGGFVIRGHACPVASAVRVQPGVCRAMEELVAGVTGEGSEVRECCDRADGGARCRFEIRRSA